MNAYLHRLPRLSLHLMAFSWSGAVAVAVLSLRHFPLSFWLLAFAYVLPALGRTRSTAFGMLGFLLSIVAAALGTQAWLQPLPTVLMVGVSLRAVTVPTHASLSAMRREYVMGLAALILAAMLRALTSGGICPIALLAVAFLLGAFTGLPLALSQAVTVSEDTLAEALPGLRFSGAILLFAGILSGLVGLGHFLVQRHALGWIGNLIWILWPLAYVASLFTSVLRNLIPSHLRPPPPILKMPSGPARHYLAEGVLQQLVLPGIAFVILAGLLILLYVVWRRMETCEDQAVPQKNAARLATDTLVTPRQSRDYGEGPRRMVRRAVARHIQPKKVRSSTTARQIAKREGWPEEMLLSYEHARYAFNRSFDKTEARAFLDTLASHLGLRRGGTRRRATEANRPRTPC